jgi:hypothetical protein
MSSTQRELFGGAIAMTLPANLVDASYVPTSLFTSLTCLQPYLLLSDFRQVPDTQELLLFPGTNISMVLEVLERVEADDLVEATKSVHLSALL